MNFHCFTSGSEGNLSYLECGDTRLLLDFGLPISQIRSSLAGIGRALESIDAVLLTHEHNDHACGLRGIRGMRLRIIDGMFRAAEIGDVVIRTIPVPHDATNPVGFYIYDNYINERMVYLTDIGTYDDEVALTISSMNLHSIYIESNYDPKMLAACPTKPDIVKSRVASGRGHLSNEQARQYVSVCEKTLKKVYLAHVSHDCNDRQIIENEFKAQFPNLPFEIV